MKIYTIGHSTHPLPEFMDMLKGFLVEKLIDVRTIPQSRFNPQFNKENLSRSLPRHGILYEHRPSLGGLRHAKKDSINTGWKNASFRGYADYMQTPEFEQALKELMEESRRKTVAIMCAEAVPWRCHRSLIADALLAHGFKVANIMSKDKETPHKINPMAQIEDKRIYYPPLQQEF